MPLPTTIPTHKSNKIQPIFHLGSAQVSGQSCTGIRAGGSCSETLPPPSALTPALLAPSLHSPSWGSSPITNTPGLATSSQHQEPSTAALPCVPQSDFSPAPHDLPPPHLQNDLPLPLGLARSRHHLEGLNMKKV